MIVLKASELGLVDDKAQLFDEIRNRAIEIGRELEKTERMMYWTDSLLFALIDLEYIIKKPEK